MKVYKFRGNAASNIDDVRMNKVHSLAESQEHTNVSAEFAHDLPFMKDDIWNKNGPEWFFGHDVATYPDVDLAQHRAEVQFNPAQNASPSQPVQPVQTTLTQPQECPADTDLENCQPGTLGAATAAGKKAAKKIEQLTSIAP